MKVTRETTGTVNLNLEGTQLEFAELCEALETTRKTKAHKDLIQELATMVREAAGLPEESDAADAD